MAHFALICPPFFSHIRVFEALAGELARRGHRLTFVLNAGAESAVRSNVASVRIVAPGNASQPIEVVIRRAARPRGPLGILRTVSDTARLTDALCRSAPAILREIGADAVIGDQMEPAAGLIAGHLGLPLASLACALPINPEPQIPLPFLPWSYDPSPKGVKRNQGGEAVARLLLTRQRRTVAAWAERFGLSPRESLADCLSPLAQITQAVESFDFLRKDKDALRYVGPIRESGGAAAALPFDIDPHRPFVFASLGTLQGHRLGLFKAVARACRELDAQLLVAHCGGLDARQAASVGATWITDFAPQRAVLARADLCVTHGGLNTVLDALEAGVPLLAIPIAFDQPGVASRIAYHGLGSVVSPRLLTARKARHAMKRLLDDDGFRERARAIGRDIAASGGLRLAADIVEEAVLASAPRRGAA
ncbi:glycosyltransferase [Consotaella salsifontis]|uniref:Zeaxanthin glucosyltransferase n=1 Tax=Consotaella salsifontis TaxID=1365950 RepID=A0A1T4L964_9HYPH|nr:nucleotide disphospho-sugar-binding domain-containing protein [Consotaella salsifontis]SJZ51047.1 zeaxanthin glucosyltransferase [Consotaella salsifontis]